ncbi:MAG: hypothetical protein PHY43_03435 [Verrucomicrobiales bacterium]|nr:hypothetical protein [Verrucomicrobiales bacterium]
MNTPTTLQPTPDLESLHKAVQEFRPNPQRVPFSNLKPFHDSIATLRDKQASYSVIAELLQQNGIKTSRARVAEYGRIALDGGKSRKRRKRARTMPAINIPATSQSAPVMAKTVLPTTAPANDVPPPRENSPYRSRGPHIANVIMMKAEEAKEFNASHPPGKTSSP